MKSLCGHVDGFPESEPILPHELLALPCDILVPAALENTIHADNAGAVRARIIAEAANGPLTPAADRILESKGVFVIPDILCNAGGVTVSYFEWVQDEQHLFWEARDIYKRLDHVMKTAFRDVLKIHLEREVSMRIAANMLGIGRVAEAVQIRGIYP
jgi:glutamate dehydrogenase/leucine dehydrogenase